MKREETQTTDLRVAIVVSEFYPHISAGLLKGAKCECSAARIGNVEVFRTGGAFETPLLAKLLLEKQCYNGLVVIGCVVRGETDHYSVIVRECGRAIMQLMLIYSIPIGYGVIAAENMKQAEKRSNMDAKNLGYRATRAMLQSLSSALELKEGRDV